MRTGRRDFGAPSVARLRRAGPARAGRRHRTRWVAFLTSAALILVVVLSGDGQLIGMRGGPSPAGAVGRAGGVLRSRHRAVAPAGPRPSDQFDCAFNLSTDAFTGADATASAIGWEGNHQGVVTCLGGTFLIQDGINQNYGFGLYRGGRTTWEDADGYLPAQITTR